MPLDALRAKAASVLESCRRAGLSLVTAESCTGGLVAGCLTEIAGASDVVERGFVTYSNQAKTDLLGVPAALIEAHGAVSEAVARAMAEGALAHSPADMSVAVTGVAGPGGGSASKPVGLVFVAAARRYGGMRVERHLLAGDRRAVRAQAVAAALDLCRAMVEVAPPEARA
ncbi:MAG: CinA family protein [Kiloniellales bacterium]